jgi:hypothetical protein
VGKADSRSGSHGLYCVAVGHQHYSARELERIMELAGQQSIAATIMELAASNRSPHRLRNWLASNRRVHHATGRQALDRHTDYCALAKARVSIDVSRACHRLGPPYT